ncbi:peptidase S8 [Lactobacillus helveticus]|uniref:S8 family serine peptidase n=1 Tax=Lactobacillus helveticus TaxID=1587 RepID=UPI00191BAD27|nr:S8 family serine peptidase [Lactobacillus helveticus]GFP07851.1 peptidase S8 [Lactobacillus helveticus]
MNKSDLKEANQFKYVYQSGQKLNAVHNQKSSRFLSKLHKKWAGATIVALASSTVLLFSSHNVKADAQAPSDDKQPDPVVQKSEQSQGQTLQAVQRKDDAVPSDAYQQSAAVQANNNNDQQAQDNKQASQPTSPVAQAQPAQQQKAKDVVPSKPQPQPQPAKQTTNGQTEDEDGQKDKNGVQLPANNQDHVKGNVQSAWDQGYRGEHTVVAVIDSGVDVHHKDFLTMPKNPKLTADQMKRLIKRLGYGRYVNEKFPFAYNYVDNENDHLKAPNGEPHGQHVSGIIAADGHPDGDNTYVVGVAPEAQLMQLKVFGDNSTSLDMAKEICDAVNLGADVINMSLGGGVSAADLNIQDQRAVQYAVDHGVVVVISAANNGNAASVDNPTHLTDLDNYQAGGNAGNYNPFSSSTVANPGAARSAITVAAETSGTGKDSDMAFFSSWGPLPDFTLKPDVSAPGYDVISTANGNSYTQMSGTSMASPFVAGAAALVRERLLKTNPKLKGAALVEAIKALLTNTADPQVQNGYNTLVSPRRQGAGQINVGAATKSPVYVTTADGTGALSLRQVGNSTTFVLNLHNLSNEEQEYNFDDFGGGFTELRNKANGVFHDVQLAGARVNGDNVVVLKPNETKQVTYTLNLTSIKKNQLVEGFLRFTNSKDKSTLVVPYLSYYGDMTKENVFDQNANDPKPDIQGNRLVNEDNYPRGIADENSLKELVNVDGNYNWQEVAKLYESGKVAFSPNGDHKSDLIKPYAYLKQNVKDLKVEILDGSGKVVRVLADSRGVEKSYHSDGDGATVDLDNGATNSDVFDWDGKLYDAKTGKMVAAPDGNYTYRFIATLYNDGPQKVQTNDTPVIIDTTAPVLSDVHYNRRSNTITGSYADKGAGFTDYSYATVTINDHAFGFKLNDGKNSGFDDANKTKGHFSFKLTGDELKALTSADNLVSVAFSDVADNTVVKSLKLDGSFDQPGVSIWNATNGLPFNENSADYDKAANTFNLRGSASDDFYLNGKWVQLDDNGQFVVPVSAQGEQDLVFSSDDGGKDVLTTFRNYTPKAKFAWQHVDGQDEHFGPAIYSIFGSNPDDIVVQAAVTKGDNVKAFAKDYFTGQIYTGVVKDGVATFHVKTSINKDPKTNIFARALLQGWTEVDGPTFNDKQKTDPTAIKDANYIGVYYDKDAVAHVYTNRDDLGVVMTDEVADPKDFGPGLYPGHSAPSAHNPHIKFDYLDDNNVASVGAEAVKKGYYNPRTHEFTLTGQVDANVISLTFLAASPYEEAAENQADISQNGKFKFSFKIPNAGTRELSYLYMTSDGKVTRGSLTLILDTVLPTLHVDQMPANRAEVEYTTSNPTFTLSGVANDNLDAYSVYINGDNVFSQFGNSGYNFIPGLYNDPKQKTPNTYGPYNFNVKEALDDENGQPTTHVFVVAIVDAVGNRVEKRLVVHYDPNFGKTAAKPEDNKGEGNKQQSTSPAEPVKVPAGQSSQPKQPTAPVQSSTGKKEESSKPAATPTKPEAGKEVTPAKPSKPENVAQPTTGKKEESSKPAVTPTKPEGGKEVAPAKPSKPASATQPTTGKKEESGKPAATPAQPAKPASENNQASQATQPSQPAGQPVAAKKDESNKQDTPLTKPANGSQSETSTLSTAPTESTKSSSENNNLPSSPAQSNEQSVAGPVKAQKVARRAKQVKLTRNARAYNLNGKLVLKKGKVVLYKKGKVLTLRNNGRVVTIKCHKYYQVGKNVYVAVANTLKQRTFKHNVAVYNHKGKKVGVLKAGRKVVLLNNGRTTTIHGKKFYQVGKDQFVKASDL